jgi:hypothetical protein
MKTERFWVLVLTVLLGSVVQAKASLPFGEIVLAIRVPMDVAIVIIAGVFALAIVLWGFAGLLHLINRLQVRKRLKLSQKKSEETFKKSLPWSIGSKATMTDAAADGLVLTLTFSIDILAADVTPDFLEWFKKKLSPLILNRDVALKDMKDGAIYRYRFVDREAKTMGLSDVTAADFT